MLVGVPKEIKNLEFRVGLTPGSVRELVELGHSVIVESGAGAGIGRACAERIAEEGGMIFGMDIRQEALDDMVESLSQKGTKAAGQQADISKPEQVNAAVAA